MRNTAINFQLNFFLEIFRRIQITKGSWHHWNLINEEREKRTIKLYSMRALELQRTSILKDEWNVSNILKQVSKTSPIMFFFSFHSCEWSKYTDDIYQTHIHMLLFDLIGSVAKSRERFVKILSVVCPAIVCLEKYDRNECKDGGMTKATICVWLLRATTNLSI